MQRVAVLSHVKASVAPPSLRSSGVRRIPWQGGKISSNKEEALQKFLQRKLRAGDQLTAQQIEATLQKEGVTSIPKKNGKHKSQVKVTSGGRTVLKTGRVLGPKLKKAGDNPKQQVSRRPKTVGKVPKKTEAESSAISLEDKLGLPLDALVGGQNKPKRSSNMKRR